MTPNRTVAPWPNVTLNGSGISCIVALPDARYGFYRNTRFDWGSMVGTITLRAPDGLNVTVSGDANSPAGFVAEFGCGGSGALCPNVPSTTRAHTPGVMNGVLGFGDAGKGGQFLKMGVGRLRRPTAGRGASHYETTWPYELAEPPAWQVERDTGGAHQGVSLEQSVRYKRWGWTLRRRVYTCDWPTRKRAAVCMDVRLTNHGEQSLRTPYCSHNLFALAGGPSTGPGFAIHLPALRDAARHFIDLGWKNSSGYLPFGSIANLILNDDGRPSHIALTRQLRAGEMALAAFNVRRARSRWDGRYDVTLPASRVWRLRVQHSLQARPPSTQGGPRAAPKPSSDWYQFTLQASRRALSPRLCTLVDLKSKETVELTHRVGFSWERVKGVA